LRADPLGQFVGKLERPGVASHAILTALDVLTEGKKGASEADGSVRRYYRGDDNGAD
jgi:hypothetical protein